MIEVLEFTFQSFWHFAGMVIILALFVQGIIGSVAVVSAMFSGKR